jgi:magnesium-transporting ATPase (P-type)
MERPPRKPGTPILGRVFLWRIALVSLLIGGATIVMFEVELALDMPLDVARTMAVNTLVIAQAFYLFNSRYLSASSLHPGLLFGNRAAWVAVGVLAALQLVFVYQPLMNAWFGTAPLELRHWLVPLAIGLAVFLAIEGEKALIRRLSASV